MQTKMYAHEDHGERGGKVVQRFKVALNMEREDHLADQYSRDSNGEKREQQQNIYDIPRAHHTRRALAEEFSCDGADPFCVHKMMDDKKTDQRKSSDLVKRKTDDLLFIHQYEKNEHDRIERELQQSLVLRGELGLALRIHVSTLPDILICLDY